LIKSDYFVKKNPNTLIAFRGKELTHHQHSLPCM
jgi:hypothetical protein